MSPIMSLTLVVAILALSSVIEKVSVEYVCPTIRCGTGLGSGSGLDFIDPSVEEELFEEVIAEDVAVQPVGSRPVDAPMCMQCGVHMVRSGSCHACPSCGNTSGCS